MKIFLLLVLVWCGMAAAAQASLISKTNTTQLTLDRSNATLDFEITAADIVGTTGLVSDVNVIVDFAKCSGRITPTGCNVDRGNQVYSNEIEFILISPTGTLVTLISNDGGEEFTDFAFEATPFSTFTTTRGEGGVFDVVMTFDDDGAPLPDVPTDGTFAPVQSLDAFNFEDAIGTWQFFAEDDVFFDPLGVFSVTLEIASETIPVPEPPTLAIFALGGIALIFGARRRQKAVSRF